jgi:hypothetical protein
MTHVGHSVTKSARSRQSAEMLRHAVPRSTSQQQQAGTARISSQQGSKAMWDTVETNTGSGSVHLSHDLPCTGCGHAVHTYLPCSDTCDCARGRDRLLSAV